MSAYAVRLHVKTGKRVYMTQIGEGHAFTAAFRVKVDAQGSAYVAGFTKEHAFPTTPDAVQKIYGGGDSDAFLVKVSPKGKIVYSTLLGGSGADQGNGLELDGAGGIFVGGTTWSADFPGAKRAAVGADAFVAHFRPGDPTSLETIVFGGSGEEKLTGLASDRHGGLFAVGYTKSTDFPVVKPVQGSLKGVSDLFLTRLVDMSTTFSTYFGGSGDDSGWGVTVDRKGNPVVAGTTDSPDLPTTTGVFQPKSGGKLDAFIAKFEGLGYQTVRATYFGGAGDDSSGYDGDDIKIDATGNVWFAGLTGSSDLPMKRPLQAKYGGGNADGFLAAFSSDLSQLCFATYNGGSDRDMMEGLDVAQNGTILASGLTFSADFPDRLGMAPVLLGEMKVNALLLHVSARCRPQIKTLHNALQM